MQRSNFWLAWFFLLILIVIGLSSCITQKRCQEKYPAQVITKDTTIIRDSIITITDTVRQEGQLIFITDTIPCPQLEYHKSVTKNNLTAKIDISKGKLNVDCKTDSLIKIIETQSHLIKTITTHNEVKINTVKEFVVHWYDIVFRFLSAVLFLILLSLIFFIKIFPKNKF